MVERRLPPCAGSRRSAADGWTVAPSRGGTPWPSRTSSFLAPDLGGAIAAFEIKDAVGATPTSPSISQGDTFHFVPSNPWVAVGWRKREAIEVELAAGVGQKSADRVQRVRRQAGRSRAKTASS